MEKWKQNFLRAPATHSLVFLNFAVFAWMFFSGVSFMAPTVDDLLRFGATNPELILGGQWYRLLTATFIHVGFIHIAANMWCLWNLGTLADQLLGTFGVIAMYVVTGIGGNLLSLQQNVSAGQNSVGAGASGAVFGIAGALIILLSNKDLSILKSERIRIRWSVVKFALINLAIGAATTFVPIVRIDNSAHIGGCITGIIVALPLILKTYHSPREFFRQQYFTFGGAALALLAWARAIFALG